MDDAELSLGKDYFVKLGTKQIPGVLSNIKYKIDVNTGEHINATILKKNEIAVVEIKLQDAIVLDAFDLHKVLGEFILIDRISNMTSACGVVEKAVLLDDKKVYTFTYNELKANGDIFEEFYYNLDSKLVQKVKPDHVTYTVGDEIPTTGKSYNYPDNFDIIIIRDKIAVKVRDKKIDTIVVIDEYEYSGVPVINGRGFELLIDSAEKYAVFVSELKTQGTNPNAEFFHKWAKFETYRKIAFINETWVI